MNLAIEARDLSKTFKGGVVAVNGLDLLVPRGCVYGLIGRNGAGKTTTIRLLLGLLRRDRGEARVLGEDLTTTTRAQRERVGYVSQTQQLPGWMTLAELCRYLSHLHRRWDAGLARDLTRRWRLPEGRTVNRLSGGQQRLAAVLLALAARPEVLLLDEPAAGLDPVARRMLLSTLVDALNHGEGCAVVLSTHLISDLERITERVGIMDRGRIVRSADLDDLLQETRRVQVVFTEASPPPGFRVPGAIRTRTLGPVVTALAHVTSETQFEPVKAIPGVRVNVFPVGLEEIFVELFGESDESPGDDRLTTDGNGASARFSDN